ncbi:MAG TPA: hypothetical protein DEO32_05570 [Ruminococcaceae bacterium]|nr:hypothetical protein [Oscillospiraceae bacterium]
MNYTYILKCSDGTLYCGWTNNLEKRLKSHNDGVGSKYTRSRLPAELVYFEKYKTKQEAMSREFKIKKLSRAEKENLINGKINQNS